MPKVKEAVPMPKLPCELEELVRSFRGAAEGLASDRDGYAMWWRYATVLDMLTACEELISRDPDYNGRIRAALDLAEKAVAVQRAEGEYREQLPKSESCFGG